MDKTKTSKDATSANAETLRRFSDAWARQDVDGLMALMTDSPIYRSSAGPRPGAVYQGREEVRAAFSRMFTNASPATAAPPPAIEPAFFGNRALSFWTLPGRAPDGSPAIVEGVDVLTFDEEGRIAVKDAYRKSW